MARPAAVLVLLPALLLLTPVAAATAGASAPVGPHGTAIAPPPVALGARAPVPPAATATSRVGSPSSLGPTGAGPFRPFPTENLTLPEPSASSAPPQSAYVETPPPVVPDTTPTVFNGTSEKGTGNVWIDFTAPAGPFGAIVFNYTGTAVGGVYDSSYRAYINGIQFLEGTTPEYGTWTALRELSEYQSVFTGSMNLSFWLGQALLPGGSFISNVSIAFYPVAPHTSAPLAPSEVIPIWAWNDTYLHEPTATIYANVTVPANATNATLELYVYGFGSDGGDEFWYTLQPAYREAQIEVDGKTLAGVLPFPYINTGGVDLFLWRPLPGSFTLTDRPYEIDLSGALGMIEGRHEFSATISGFSSGTGSEWLVGGSILVYTSPKAGAATETEYTVTGGTPTTSSSSTASTSSEARTITTASTFTENGTLVNQTTLATESMENDQQLHNFGSSAVASFFQNDSMSESMGTTTWRNASGATWTTERSLTFPFTIDTDDKEVNVGSSGGNTLENVSDAVTSYHQDWDELDASGPGLSPQLTGAIVRLDDQTAAEGVWYSQEEVSSGGSATLTAIFGSISATSKAYTYSALGGLVPVSYQHLLDGGATDPAGPDDAETVLENAVAFPLQAAATGGGRSIDLGASLTFTARTSGGSGPYSYAWTDLPEGCVGADQPQLTCTPVAPGSSDPTVMVTDATGNATEAVAGPVEVYAKLGVSVDPTRGSWDAGQSAVFAAAVSGGDPSGLMCRWWNVTGGPQVALSGPQPCNETLALPLFSGETPAVEVSAVDGAGGNVTSAPASVTVNAIPTVAVAVTSSNTTAHPGGYVTVVASVFGGTAPYTYQWSVNGTNVSGATGVGYTVPVAGTGQWAFVVWATDAANVTVFSASVAANVTAAPKAAPTTTSSGGTTVDYTGWYVAIAAAAVAVVLALLLVLRRPPPPPAARRAPGPARPRPPPS